jgi:hypothetical protein
VIQRRDLALLISQDVVELVAGSNLDQSNKHRGQGKPMKISLLRVLLLTIFCSHLTSCTHVDAKEDNIEALKQKKVAAVISGCTSNHNAEVLFFNPRAKGKCTTTWEGTDGRIFHINGYMDIAFVEPGAYEFVQYNKGKSFSYEKYTDSISIFNKLILKGGEVAYIGHLNVDVTKTRHALKAMSVVEKASLAKKYLEEAYPELTSKMQYSPITFTPAAEESKKFLSYLDKK